MGILKVDITTIESLKMCPGYIWCHLTRAVEFVFRNNDVDDEQDMLMSCCNATVI